MIYSTPLSWPITGFMLRVIRKALRRELDREPSRVETTGGCTEPNSVLRCLFIMDLPLHGNASFKTAVMLKQEKG